MTRYSFKVIRYSSVIADAYVLFSSHGERNDERITVLHATE